VKLIVGPVKNRASYNGRTRPPVLDLIGLWKDKIRNAFAFAGVEISEEDLAGLAVKAAESLRFHAVTIDTEELSVSDTTDSDY
jgi:hypothetical protein